MICLQTQSSFYSQHDATQLLKHDIFCVSNESLSGFGVGATWAGWMDTGPSTLEDTFHEVFSKAPTGRLIYLSDHLLT